MSTGKEIFVPDALNWVQATPNCAFLFVLAQVSGAPDAERWP
jgi:hypothetical protein